MSRLLLVFAIACSARTQQSSGASGSAAPMAVDAAVATGSAKPRPYTGPPERGPCQDAHGCKLRDVCGCSCEGVVLSAPSNVDCDKSCDAKPCKGATLICELSSQTCGAIPPPP